MQNITQNNDADALESQISEAEIRYAIGKLKSDRSGGPDGLCIEMFKAVLDDIMPFLLVLFNNNFNSGIFPESWCESIISPIHKSGPINKVSKGAKIRNRYNQVPHLTQDTNGKVTNSQ